MPRSAGHTTEAGRRWSDRLRTAQARVDEATLERDELAVQALDDGLGVRGVAAALGVDVTTAQRRYSAKRSAR